MYYDFRNLEIIHVIFAKLMTRSISQFLSERAPLQPFPCFAFDFLPSPIRFCDRSSVAPGFERR